MTSAPSDSDPFFQLLSDALRAGPGSAQWGEAVSKLRDGGVEGADEYRLILRAREDLEQGRDFRRVTAGPGFTRKVLEAVEQEGGRKRNGLPTATLIAILAGVVLLGVIIAALVLSRGGPGGGTERVALERLEAASLSVSLASGSLPGRQKGFDVWPEVASTSTSTQPASAGTRLVTAQPLDASHAASVEAEVLVPTGGGPHLMSMFVADGPDPTTAPHGISLFYNDGRVSVEVEGRTGETVDLAPSGTLKASIRFDGEVAIVEAGGRRVYAGPHGLGDAPRYAGMRLLPPAGGAGEGLRVKSIAVAQAAAPAAAEGR